MIKKIFISLFFLLAILSEAYAAGSSDSGTTKVKSNYDKAVSFVKTAKNLEKKGKVKKQIFK